VEVKKLVYMYLVHHADANATCRELALLAINSFQRDLADPNQLIRALALRVLCSIRVREIVQIQLMSVKKCATDRCVRGQRPDNNVQLAGRGGLRA
jgi:AP-3 complex subunit beta